MSTILHHFPDLLSSFQILPYPTLYSFSNFQPLIIYYWYIYAYTFIKTTMSSFSAWDWPTGIASSTRRLIPGTYWFFSQQSLITYNSALRSGALWDFPQKKDHRKKPQLVKLQRTTDYGVPNSNWYIYNTSQLQRDREHHGRGIGKSSKTVSPVYDREVVAMRSQYGFLVKT